MSKVSGKTEVPGAQGLPGPNVLSFDVEEYFHAEAAQCAGVSRESWPTLQRRCGGCVDQLLEKLERRRIRATFFILGWLAEHDPQVVRRIAAAGHEVASHGMSHHMLGRLTPQEFADELTESRRRLEDLAGQPVRGYRAPTFSVTHATAWAVDVLAECGYAYDSSIFPVRHDRYGVPEAPVEPHWAVGPGGGEVFEIPPLTRRLMGTNLPVAGGGYLRLLPVRIMGGALHRAHRAGRPGMIYLHPWEIDPGHPEMGMKGLSRFRHRVNLHRTSRKLQWLLNRFAFCAAGDVLEDLQARFTGRYRYGTVAFEAGDRA